MLPPGVPAGEEASLRACPEDLRLGLRQTVVPCGTPDQTPLRAAYTPENLRSSTGKHPVSILPFFMRGGEPPAHGWLL